MWYMAFFSIFFLPVMNYQIQQQLLEIVVIRVKRHILAFTIELTKCSLSTRNENMIMKSTNQH